MRPAPPGSRPFCGRHHNKFRLRDRAVIVEIGKQQTAHFAYLQLGPLHRQIGLPPHGIDAPRSP